MKTKFIVGDRVAYNKAFLKRCGGNYDFAAIRGTITALTRYSSTHEVATIKWEGNLFPDLSGAATANLCRVAHIAADSVS